MHGYGGSKSYTQLLTTMSLFQAWRVPGSLAVVVVAVVVVVTLFWRSYWSLSLSLSLSIYLSISLSIYIYIYMFYFYTGRVVDRQMNLSCFSLWLCFHYEVLLQIRMFWVKLYMTPFEHIIHLFGHMLNFGAATWIPSQGNEIVNHLLCTSKVSMKVALLTTLLRFTPLAFFLVRRLVSITPLPHTRQGLLRDGTLGFALYAFL